MLEASGLVFEGFLDDIEEGVEMPPVGSSGPDSALAVYPELFEMRKIADTGFPHTGTIEVDLPIGDAGAAGDFGVVL